MVDNLGGINLACQIIISYSLYIKPQFTRLYKPMIHCQNNMQKLIKSVSWNQQRKQVAL